jgi:hypothetical protein
MFSERRKLTCPEKRRSIEHKSPTFILLVSQFFFLLLLFGLDSYCHLLFVFAIETKEIKDPRQKRAEIQLKEEYYRKTKLPSSDNLQRVNTCCSESSRHSAATKLS